MKATFFVAAAGFAASLVSAQLDQIPQCALNCAVSSLGSTGCQTSDFKCICQAKAFIDALTPCVQKSCSAADFQKTLQGATALCAAAGVSLSVPGPTAAQSSVSSAASSVSSVASSVSSVVSSVYGSVTSAASTLSTALSNTSVSTHVPVPTGGSNNTITTGKPTGNPTATGSGKPTGSGGSTSAPTPTGNAAGRNAAALGGAAVLAFAAAALL